MVEHGSFIISVQNKTLIVEKFESWNSETAKRFSTECRRLILPFKQSKWGSIIDLRKWDLATPEALSVIRELNKWKVCQNQKCIAIVFNSNIQKKILEKHSVLTTEVETRYDKSIDEAYEWFKKEGLLINE